MKVKIILAVVASVFLTGSAMAGKIGSSCRFQGVPLYGRVKVIESGRADFKVKIVNSFADLHVKDVSSFPNSCGLWKYVNSSPDFTVKFVDSFPDFTIREVRSFPGVP